MAGFKANEEARRNRLASMTDVQPQAEPVVVPRGRRVWLWPSVAVGALVFGLWAASLCGVFKVKTPDGVIVLEGVPQDAEVLVDGGKIAVTWPGAGKPFEIQFENTDTMPHNLVFIQPGQSLPGLEILLRGPADSSDLDQGGQRHAAG